MKFLLDEGVPVAVGRVLKDAGHEVIFFSNSGLAKGTADTVICAAAEQNNATLVAADADMKNLARGHGITPARFKTLWLVQFQCSKPSAAARMKAAMSLIEHEQTKVDGVDCVRLFVVIGEAVIRTHR